MNLSITRRQRAFLLFLSASSLAAWFSGLGEGLSAQEARDVQDRAFIITARNLPPPLASVITRDPFAGAPAAPLAAVDDRSGAPSGADEAYATPSAAGSHDSQMPPDFAGADGIIVPNIGDEESPSPPLTLQLRATIAGPNPVAYVQSGTMMDIVRVGDKLGAHRVTTIDLRGIGFDDGARLNLPSGYLATSSPVAPVAHSIALSLDDIRKLLSGRSYSPVSGAHSTAKPSAVPTAVATSLPAAPATVDPAGVEPGTTPVPEADGATPYPYPYPYAPRAR